MNNKKNHFQQNFDKDLDKKFHLPCRLAHNKVDRVKLSPLKQQLLYVAAIVSGIIIIGLSFKTAHLS